MCRRYEDTTVEAVAVKAAADLGSLFLDGLADGIRIDAPHLSEKEIAEIELMILQAARVRMSRTEYIACPSCGRTLYDIEGTLAAIRARTSHLKNLKIGVMGCIVNGPGEMADADYGYVGAAPGRITLYKGRTVVEKNIPQEEALDRLVALIKANGDWADPENQPERPCRFCLQPIWGRSNISHTCCATIASSTSGNILSSVRSAIGRKFSLRAA